MPSSSRFALTIAVILTCAIAFAGNLSRLPGDRPLSTSEGSPGQVVFSHQSHVDASRPDCTICHSRTFPILPLAAASRPVIRHDAMEKGAFCGNCHNGKAAFGFEDCSSCHRSDS